MRTNGAHDGGVQQHLAPARLQHRALQRRDQVAHVEVDDVLQLVARAVQEARRARKLAAGRVLLHLRSGMGMSVGRGPHVTVTLGMTNQASLEGLADNLKPLMRRFVRLLHCAWQAVYIS